MMELGVMLIVVRDGESGDNPYKTGQIYCITDEAAARMIQPEELLADVLKKRMTFIEQSVAEMLGLGDMEPTHKEIPHE